MFMERMQNEKDGVGAIADGAAWSWRRIDLAQEWKWSKMRWSRMELKLEYDGVGVEWS